MNNTSGSTLKQRHEVDWSKDDEIIDFVKCRWNNKDYFKRGLERKWIEVIAAYEGLTYHTYDHTIRRLVNDLKVPTWRVKLVINLMLPYIRTGVAKHVRNRPIFDVTPATTDSRDYDIASAGKKYLRGFWYNNGLNYDFIDLLLWLGLTGNAFINPIWNPDIGPQLELEIKDFLDPQAMQMVQMASQGQDNQAFQTVLKNASDKFENFVRANGSTTYNLGDNEFNVFSPFDVLAPYAKNFYKCDWYIFSQLKNISYYADLGIDTDTLERPTVKDARYQYYVKRVDNLQFLGYGDGDYNEVDDKQILDLQLWLPQSRQLPHGYHCVIAGGKLIHKGENPYNHRKVPMVHFGSERTPGKIWYFSSAEHALPVMRQYQQTQSQLIEIKNLMSKPKWLVSRSANIKSTAITSEPGEIIEYTGGLKPETFQPPSIPQYVLATLEMNKFDMDSIFAQRDATKGINPSGSRSATMLSNLQSQDDGQLAVTALNLDTGFSLVGRLLLSNAAQFIKEDRLITYTGEKNRYETIALKEGMLQGPNNKMFGVDYFNVRVDTFSQFGLTRTGQIELLKPLLQYNIFNPNDRAKIFKFIQMGFFEDDIDDFKIDRANANKENMLMLQGQDIIPDISESSVTHVEEHELFMKGDRYATAPPQIKNIFIKHLTLTKMFAVGRTLEPQILMIPAQQYMVNLISQQLGVDPRILGEMIANAGRNQTNGNPQGRTTQAGSSPS